VWQGGQNYIIFNLYLGTWPDYTEDIPVGGAKAFLFCSRTCVPGASTSVADPKYFYLDSNLDLQKFFSETDSDLDTGTDSMGI
jgi:hypothetical protein